jgi:hypothetical protein
MVMAVNQERVNAVCDELANAGKGATLAAVRDALGEGSFSTLGPMVRAWKAGRGTGAGDVVAVTVPDAVQAVGGRMLAEVWVMAERMAGERLGAERAAMDAARVEMAGELEAAYADMEGLREALAQAKAEMMGMAERERAAVAELAKAQAEVQGLQVEAAAARAEAGAYKLAIETIEIKKTAAKKPPSV